MGDYGDNYTPPYHVRLYALHDLFSHHINEILIHIIYTFSRIYNINTLDSNDIHSVPIQQHNYTSQYYNSSAAGDTGRAVI